MMQSISVNINMDSQIIIGTVTLPEGRRLTDFLNGHLPGIGEVVSSQFIKLTDVNIFHKDGRRETSETIFINRQAIQMLRTISADDARGIGATKNPGLPFIPKQPLKVAIYTEDYELIGHLHCREKQDISNILTRPQTFLPCTDVKIHDFKLNSWDDAGFVAINSNLVFSIKQE